jgi:hypothetical protein
MKYIIDVQAKTIAPEDLDHSSIVAFKSRGNVYVLSKVYTYSADGKHSYIWGFTSLVNSAGMVYCYYDRVNAIRVALSNEQAVCVFDSPEEFADWILSAA